MDFRQPQYTPFQGVEEPDIGIGPGQSKVGSMFKGIFGMGLGNQPGVGAMPEGLPEGIGMQEGAQAITPQFESMDLGGGAQQPGIMSQIGGAAINSNKTAGAINSIGQSAGWWEAF